MTLAPARPIDEGDTRRGRRAGGRKNGEGTYDTHVSGRRRYRQTYLGPDRRTRVKELKAATDKELRAKVKAWQAELSRGLPAADENPPLDVVIDRWLATKVDLRPNSVRDYGQTAARLKKGLGGGRTSAGASASSSRSAVSNGRAAYRSPCWRP